MRNLSEAVELNSYHNSLYTLFLYSSLNAVQVKFYFTCFHVEKKNLTEAIENCWGEKNEDQLDLLSEK